MSDIMELKDFLCLRVMHIDRHIFDVPVPYEPFTSEYQAFVNGINAINDYYLSFKTFNPYEQCVLPCPCGKKPKFVFRNVTYGQGEYGTTCSLSCSCGRTTKEYEVSGIYGCKDSLHTVVNAWNMIFGGTHGL